MLNNLFSSNKKPPQHLQPGDGAPGSEGMDDLDFDIPSVEDLQKEEYLPDIQRNDKSTSMNILAQGAVLKGNINLDGQLKIYGRVEGEITSSSEVYIGDSGIVEGNIKAASMEVAGTFRGNAEVSGALLVSSTGKIIGDLMIGTLNFSAGAVMRGTILMNMPQPGTQEMVPVEITPEALAIAGNNGKADQP